MVKNAKNEKNVVNNKVDYVKSKQEDNNEIDVRILSNKSNNKIFKETGGTIRAEIQIKSKRHSNRWLLFAYMDSEQVEINGKSFLCSCSVSNT